MKGSEDECLVAVRSLEMSVLKCAEASGSLRGGSAHFRKLPWVPAAVLNISESFPGCQRWFCTFQKASLGASGGSAHFRKLPWVPAVVLHISESFPGCQQRFCTFQKASSSSKRFIDVEEEARLPAFPHTVVEADVDVLLKLPTIADAPVG